MHEPSAAPCAIVDRAGKITSADETLAVLLGVPAGDLVGRDLGSFASSPEDSTAVLQCLGSVADGATAGQVRVKLTTDDDWPLSVHLVVTPCPDDAMTVVVIDETARVDAERELEQSERRWFSLLRNSADIIFTTADDGSLTSVTSALPVRLGWAVTDVVGRDGLSFVHPDDRFRANHAWLDVSTGHRTEATLEIRLKHLDQSVSWGRLVIHDLRDDPDVRAVIGNVTDITEQKAEEARRRLGEARFRARFDQSRVPQVIQARDGTYDAVNDAFCTLLGRTREELVGRTASAVTHPDDPGEAELAAASLRRGDVESVQVDRLMADADGNPVPVRVDAALLRDADGEPDGCAASLQDLRPLRDSELARAAVQGLFDVVAERSREFITLYDADGKNVFASAAGLAMFGEHYNAAAGRWKATVHPDDLAYVKECWVGMQSQREARSWRFRVKNAAGDWIWIEQTATNLLDTAAAVIVSAVRDVTGEVEAAKALRVSEGRYRAIAETAEEGILVIAPGGIVTYVNARLATMLGLDPNRVLGHPVWAVLDSETAEDVAIRAMNRHLRGPERYEVAYQHPDGTSRVLWIAASPMPEAEGMPQGSLAMIYDITEQRQRELELRHAAEHDELTGLLNRSMLMNHLGQPDGEGVAVLFIDLDHFKEINDGRGHTTGDDVLIEVASRLETRLEPDDLIARFGGDEFAVVLHDVDADIALSTARRLLDVLSTTYRIGHQTLRIGASIGIAMSPASSGEDLLRFADTAMYAAKASGRGRVRMFDEVLAEQAEERHTLGAELMNALATDALEMYYQPVIDISTGEVAGVEALARWHHPTRGTIAPSRFVALAELSASSSDLDRWVIRRTMRDIAELKADQSMPEAATVAINLSGQSLVEGLDTFIVGCARDAGLEPDVVTLEITESAVMADKDIAIDVLQRLRDHGFGIAIDDFGTGYNSMAYLRDLPITVLKIDRGFVEGIPEDAPSLAIVTSLIEIARSLDLTVVAEGVETPAHLDALRARGCTLAQGWLWSAALSPDELRKTQMFDTRFDTDALAPG